MYTVIQIIKTEWTKKSRGCPGATLRNSVPNHFPISAPLNSKVSLQQVSYFESNDFSSPLIEIAEELDKNNLREIRLELERKGESLEVGFWGTPVRPSYGKCKSIALLSQNQWLQIIGNARIPYEDTTGYIKYVYNIYYGQLEKSNEIVSNSKAIVVFNEEVNLH